MHNQVDFNKNCALLLPHLVTIWKVSITLTKREGAMETD